MANYRADDPRCEAKPDSGQRGSPGLVARAAGWTLSRAAAAAAAGENALADARRVCSFLRGRIAFRPRPDDIHVVSYPRSGTTWMQHMLHCLVGRDEVDFAHISQVSPWFERSLAIGTMTAADFESFASPRILKSHLPYGWLPHPGRYLYLWRDGPDVAVSYFHFYRAYLGCRDDFATFFRRFLRGDLQYRSWFDHVDGWLAHADAPEVLVVRYEDLHGDRAAVLRRVVAHLGLAVSEERLARVVAETSFAAMKGHESKFDHATALLLERGSGPRAFLRRGLTGEGATVLDAAQRAAFDRRLHTTAQRPSREMRLSAFLH
ncbi:MAG: sulfotransferase domain-containing protein [Deltaproteobacteria bacterium]|nr:sulfotransferase domain-containing protein [Deltaproteobacteria bacterium]